MRLSGERAPNAERRILFAERRHRYVNDRSLIRWANRHGSPSWFKARLRAALKERPLMEEP